MDTFERKETKYLLSPMQYIQFRALAEQHLAAAEYPEGDVSSTYYDTPDNLLVNRSLQGARYKEKLRIRSYGQAAPESLVFIEVKKKFKGITYKRRVGCTLAAAEAFLAGMDFEEAIERWPLADAEAREACHSAQSLQIAGEIAWMRDRYADMAPKMNVATHRQSFVGADNPELRLTFDSNLRWQQVDGDGAWNDLFANDERILEVKCAQAYPLWLVEALNDCGLRPQSASKYGLAYQAAMAATRKAVQEAIRERMVGPEARSVFAPSGISVQAPVLQPAEPKRARGHVAAIRVGSRAQRKGIAAALRAFAPAGLTHKPAHAAHR